MTISAPQSALLAHPIPPAELRSLYRDGVDVAGNPPQEWADPAGVPLRCCLRHADAEDRVVLISHAPLSTPSAWREVGPVFVHAAPCAGYQATSGLPADIRTGPKVLRGYRDDGTLDYGAIEIVADHMDIAPALRTLLAMEGINEVHVRATREQCFTYRVTRADQ